MTHQYIIKCSVCGKQSARTNTRPYKCSVCKLKSYPKEFLSQRNVIKQGGECLCCHSKNNLGVHHKDNNRQNNSTTNLMVLCRQCHAALHRYFGKQFNELVLSRVSVRVGQFGVRIDYDRVFYPRERTQL